MRSIGSQGRGARGANPLPHPPFNPYTPSSGSSIRLTDSAAISYQHRVEGQDERVADFLEQVGRSGLPPREAAG